ncbi:MAG TPA: cobyrinate a,c-diamide synthase [Acidimicrobiales bacterium]|nr:cobyrinate a,c-diamide synthase [Acidimicrobiales bacterium]
MDCLGPRLVVAGTHSGVGKTTVATGLMAALARRGLQVGAAKVGPDFIDPGYHGLATGRPSRNLDAWICGAEAVAPMAAKAGSGAAVLIVEGVMGLFDGAAEDGETASTAHVARLLDAPVLLVVDAAALSGSVAALVHGFRTFDRSVRVAGVVLNRVGSEGHEVMLREALAPLDVPILGVLRRDDRLAWRDRHLGLVPVVEQEGVVRDSLERLASIVSGACDLDRVLALAGEARPRTVSPLPPAAHVARVRVAVAQGPAFSFVYPDNGERLEEAGAELVPFDPLEDAALPPGVSALYAGGGFPEVYAEGLSANRGLLGDLRARIAGGLAAWAECGGLLWLARSLDGRALAGVVDATATMTDRLTLGYRRARVLRQCPLGAPGTELRGHEFHYSTVTPEGDALALESRFGRGTAGFAGPTLLASYLHLHLASRPDLAEAFVRCAARTTLSPPQDSDSRCESGAGAPL